MSFTPTADLQTLDQVQTNVNEGHYATWQDYYDALYRVMEIQQGQRFEMTGDPALDRENITANTDFLLKQIIPTWGATTIGTGPEGDIGSNQRALANLGPYGSLLTGDTSTGVTDTGRLKQDVVGGGGLTAAEIQRDRQTALSATIGGQRVTFGQEMAAAPYTMGQVTPFARSAMEAQFDPFSAAYSLSQLTPMATGADVPYGYGGAGAGTTFQEWMRDPTSQRLGAEDWTGFLGQLAGGIPQGAFAADPSVEGGFSFTPSSLPGGIAGYTEEELDQRARMKAGWERLSDPVIGSNIIQQYALGPGAAAGGGISPMARGSYINALQDQFSAYQATPQGAVTPLMSKFLGGGFGLGYGP